jgi:hypothetical protein
MYHDSNGRRLDEKPRPMGTKGGANQEFGALASSALGEGYHRIRAEPSSGLKSNEFPKLKRSWRFVRVRHRSLPHEKYGK